MIVSLTGFMGSGKSSVGAVLAGNADCTFVDLDSYIEHKIGLSIPDIFSLYGETRFRNIEVEAIKDVVTLHEISGESVVIALGGGTLCNPSVQSLILNRTTCIYLQADKATIAGRLGSNPSGRPLFKEGWEELLEKRRSIYELCPNVVDVNGKTLKEVCAEIENNYLSQSI